MINENQPLEEEVHLLLVGPDGEVKLDSKAQDHQPQDSEEDNGE
jgi:hypothetical protein